MVRSLYSGVSGLTSHQTKMDVIGNNIANVNTYGFKSSRASFSDVFYQSVKTAAAGTESFAGNNPSTVGYGTQVASIDRDMSQSSFQSTNRTLDLAISGDGFFATGAFSSGADGGAPDLTASPDSITYTRNGNFGIDSAGNLVSNNNRFILGTRNTEKGLLLNSDLSAQELLKNTLQDNNGDNQINSTDYTFENTINVNDLIADAYGIYTDTDTGYLYTNRKPEAVIKDGKIVGYKQGTEYYAAEKGGSVKVETNYSNDYDDPAKGKECAKALHDLGADVIFQIASKAGDGVFEAAQEGGFYAIGVDSDQKYIADDVIICSMKKEVGTSIYEAIKAYLNGDTSLWGTTWIADMSNGYVGIGYGEEGSTQQVPDEVKAEVEALAAKIVSGEIKVDTTRG